MNASFYNEIKKILISARNKVYQTANFAMVEAYWNIGKSIIEEQGGNEKAEYGTGLLKELSKQMTQDFGKGFTVANLKNMRQFYLTFPNGYALRSELSWTHYRLLMRVENENAREFYMQEAVKSQWSTRQLERQINSFFYERLLSSKNKEQLMQMFREVADIQTADMLKLPVPKVNYHNIKTKPSEIQTEMVASLAKRAEKVRARLVEPNIDNMLKITNDGRKLALDQRMIDPMLPDDPESKVNTCVDNVYRIWKEHADTKATQLVFCDLSTTEK